MLVMFIATAIDLGTRFTTNSASQRCLRSCPSGRPSGCGRTAIITTGGSWLTTLKRLYGAALRAPSAERVVTMARRSFANLAPDGITSGLVQLKNFPDRLLVRQGHLVPA